MSLSLTDGVALLCKGCLVAERVQRRIPRLIYIYNRYTPNRGIL